MRVGYEDLVSQPERMLERVCRFVGIDFRPELVEGTGFAVPRFTTEQHALVGRPPNPARMQAWKKALTPREIEVFESIAVDLLSGLGYELLYGWRARRMTSSERVKFIVKELYRRNIVNRTRLRRRIRRSVFDIESQGKDSESRGR
jgi:hypothetical protein